MDKNNPWSSANKNPCPVRKFFSNWAWTSAIKLKCTSEIASAYLEKEFGAYDFYTPAMGYASKEWIKAYLLSLGLNLEKQGFIMNPNFLWRRYYDKFLLDKTQQRSLSLNHHQSDV